MDGGNKNENLPPLSQLKPVMQQLLSSQSKEIEQLNQILSKGNLLPILTGDGMFSPNPHDRLRPEFKTKILQKLKASVNTGNIKSISEVYFQNETFLDDINALIIEECLNSIELQTGSRNKGNGWKDYKELSLNLKGVITRLSKKGIDIIKDKIFFTDADVDIKISLPCNSLRWLPDELFLIPRIKTLDLRNNLLLDIPPSIEHMKEDLKHLYIGNFKSLGDRCACCDGIGRRTSGNSFKVIPGPILKLNNLKRLDIRSVGLEQFKQEKVYRSLPKLSYINLAHNELTVLPESTSGTRKIMIQTIGNPVYGLLTSNMDVWDYRFNKYFRAPIIRSINYPLTIAYRHPYISGPTVLGVGLLLNYYGYISFNFLAEEL